MEDLATMLEGKCEVYAPKIVVNFDPVLARQPFLDRNSEFSTAMTLDKRTVVPVYHRNRFQLNGPFVKDSNCVATDLSHEVGHLLEQERKWLDTEAYQAYLKDRSSFGDDCPARFPHWFNALTLDDQKIVAPYMSRGMRFELLADLYAISLGKTKLPQTVIDVLTRIAYPETWQALTNSNWGR